jgi:hypothetical protein
MPPLDKEDLLELKRAIEAALEETDKDIVLYSPHSDEERFLFLLKKAISYRDTLKKINEELSKL